MTSSSKAPTIGSKIHDLAAHSSVTTCLRISPKSGKIMVTGGEDRKVNLWTLGRTAPVLVDTPQQSLSGHASSIESVTIDWPEEIVVAGSSSGTIKLWDLEHAKVVRTMMGHKQAVSSVEFHPFGEFFASGSADSSVKIWDIRRKGCIQTYVGHQAAVPVLRISPDGRWIITGGTDGMTKLWDMTAGKILQTFTVTNAEVVTAAFNPVELMMATICSDQKIRFYDLETLGEICTSEPLSTKPRAMEFHGDGQQLFVACQDSLQVWSWEPLGQQDIISMPWPNVSDIKIVSEGKLLGASLDQNLVGIWGVMFNRLKPFEQSMVAEPRQGTRIFELVFKKLTLVYLEMQARATDAKGIIVSVHGDLANMSLRDPTANDEQIVPSVASNKSIFVSTSGSKPLNLDLSKFIQYQDRGRNPTPLPLSPTDSDPLSPTSENDVIDALEFRHISISSILTNRLSNIQAVKAAWNEGNLRPAVETLSSIRDVAVSIDILKIMNLKPSLFTLDLATEILPIVQEILFTVYEDYIVTACTTIRLLCRSFAHVILETLSVGFNSPGIDLNREDRHRRCNICLKHFMDIYATLAELKRAPGRIGMAVKEASRDLEVFRRAT
ncbi:WD repeat-containing protein 90 [Blyttiomyces sp. JEL0837]|nr:WD repeat-containing protein 90 [Blyttiomyces sp. JEL0837]